MSITICHGRPETADGRTSAEIAVYDLLDALGISYDRADHEAAFTMEACKEVDEAFGTPLCKNLFLRNRQGTAFYLLLMPDDKPFKTKELSAQIQSARLSFAGEEDMVRLLGLHPGSVSVMGLMNDAENQVRLLIDRDLLDAEHLCCHPVVNTSSLRLKTKDVLDVFLPKVKHAWTPVELTGVE